MSPKTRRFTKRFCIRTAGYLLLFLLSASVLSASHVHDLDTGLAQSHFEHCAAFHITDHQQVATTEVSSVAPVIYACRFSIEVQSTISRLAILPPSRAPPLIS